VADPILNHEHHKVRQLAATFLDDYSDSLSNAGCNDWKFPLDWTTAERQEFCRMFHELNGDPENYNPNRLVLDDHCVAWLLSKIVATEERT
jgi:hypothetical protein